MLSNEDNALVTNIEKGAPMGEVFRRFWLPLMLASELPTPDCEPARVTILGEKLIAFLQRELTAPVDIERIVAGARNKEEAVEIYTASLMAVRSDTPQEREYLATLSGRLKLEPGLVASIEKTVEAVAIK